VLITPLRASLISMDRTFIGDASPLVLRPAGRYAELGPLYVNRRTTLSHRAPQLRHLQWHVACSSGQNESLDSWICLCDRS